MELLSIIFYKLLRMSLIASFIGLAICFVKKFLYKRIPPKILYIMWIIFLLALVVPPFIQSRASVYNYIDISQIENAVSNYEMSKARSQESKLTEITTINKESDSERKLRTSTQDTEILPRLEDLLPMIWILGVGTLFAVYAISNILFKIKIGKQEFKDNRLESILEVAKSKIMVSKNIILLKQNTIKTPAIIGVVKPKILLTEDIVNYNDTEIEYIFRHELAHYKRKDNIINFILIILRNLHWFNPIIWFVMREIRKDMELAADEQAVEDLKQDDKKEYCKLLVSIANSATTGFMEKTIGITDDKNNLEKRINMIKLSDKISKHPVFASSLVFIIIGLICLILYTNNYYQPNLDLPPKLYLKYPSGKVTEMLVTKYQWINGEEVKNYDMKFDPNNYDFNGDNTIYGIVDPGFVYFEATVYTEPKIRMVYLNDCAYRASIIKLENSENYVQNKNIIPNVNDIKYEGFEIENGVQEIEVYFPNGSVATYVARSYAYDFCKAEIFEKYGNTDIEDKAKVESFVKEMTLGEFLNECKIENNILYLDYQYVQEKDYAYDMAVVLFTNIPKLEKIVITTGHKTALYLIDMEYDTSIPLEITRESANQNGSVSIDTLQKIIKES